MEIKTLAGETFLIDKKDYEKVSQHEWRLSAVQKHVYTVESFINKKDVKSSRNKSLHYWLLGYPSDPNASNGKAQVKHKNGNKLDNRRSNLEIIRNKPPVELKCKNCENSYMACGDIARRMFCSTECCKEYAKKEREEKKKKNEPQPLTADDLTSNFFPATKPRKGMLILDRDGLQCALCGKSAHKHGVEMHIDHIMPWSKGGRDYAYNLITLCAGCNHEKSNFLLEEKNIEKLQAEARRRNAKIGISDNLRIRNSRNYRKWGHGK